MMPTFVKHRPTVFEGIISLLFSLVFITIGVYLAICVASSDNIVLYIIVAIAFLVYGIVSGYSALLTIWRMQDDKIPRYGSGTDATVPYYKQKEAEPGLRENVLFIGVLATLSALAVIIAAVIFGKSTVAAVALPLFIIGLMMIFSSRYIKRYKVSASGYVMQGHDDKKDDSGGVFTYENCPNCGTMNEVGNKVCRICGKRL